MPWHHCLYKNNKTMRIWAHVWVFVTVMDWLMDWLEGRYRTVDWSVVSVDMTTSIMSPIRCTVYTVDCIAFICHMWLHPDQLMNEQCCPELRDKKKAFLCALIGKLRSCKELNLLQHCQKQPRPYVRNMVSTVTLTVSAMATKCGPLALQTGMLAEVNHSISKFKMFVPFQWIHISELKYYRPTNDVWSVTVAYTPNLSEECPPWHSSTTHLLFSSRTIWRVPSQWGPQTDAPLPL